MPKDMKFSFLFFLSLINISTILGFELCPCQQNIPNELYLSLGYLFRFDISIIIS